MQFLIAGNISKVLRSNPQWVKTGIMLLKSVKLFHFVLVKIWSLKFKTKFKDYSQCQVRSIASVHRSEPSMNHKENYCGTQNVKNNYMI